MEIPPEWKSKRQIIIETYIQVRSVPIVAKRLKYASPSFVRFVVSEYRKYLRNKDTCARFAGARGRQ
jgi:hypothetical protein